MSAQPQSQRATTTVKIYGTDYAVRSQADPEYVKQIAEVVDGHMRRLSQNRVVRSNVELAVLAAMHLADELSRTREQLQQVLQRVGDTTDALERVIDEGSSIAVSR